MFNVRETYKTKLAVFSLHIHVYEILNHEPKTKPLRVTEASCTSGELPSFDVLLITGYLANRMSLKSSTYKLHAAKLFS